MHSKRYLGIVVILIALFLLAACSSGSATSDNRAITEPRVKESGESGAAVDPPAVSDKQIPESESTRPDYEIITLLPRDAIPAVFEPEFVSGDEADEQYLSGELVIGVELDGDARAYSIPFLSGHEIVNDMVGGRPIAVTW